MNVKLVRDIIEKRIEIVEREAFKAFIEVPKGRHVTLGQILDLMVKSGNAVDSTIGKLAQLGDALCAKKALMQLEEGIKAKSETTEEPNSRPEETKKRELGKPPADDKRPHPDFIVKEFSSEAEMRDFLKNHLDGFLKEIFGAVDFRG